MNQIDNFLGVFENLLKTINGDNLVVTGGNVLKLHGLIMNRECMDLDVLIYNPTPEQYKKLDDISFFELSSQLVEYPIQEVKQVKFKKHDYCVDIFLLKKDTPNNCLVYEFNGIRYKVAPIDEIIKAKASYGYLRNKAKRTKDVLDLQDLKNSNFNY